MNRRHAPGIGLILSLAVLVSCGTDNGTISPKAIDGVLLRASDLPAMRLEGEDPAPDAAAFAEVLGGPEACACPTVFKDEPGVVTEKLNGFGFKRGYAELWVGAGLHGSAFAAEFDTAEHAKAALDYMDTELFRECIDEPFCSSRERIKRSEIPDFVGLAITPLRPKEQGRRATLYKFLFRVDTVVYGAMNGASGAYDPGSVSQDQALAMVQRFYDRVKGRDISDVLRSAPASPTHPDSGVPPELTTLQEAEWTISLPVDFTRQDATSDTDAKKAVRYSSPDGEVYLIVALDPQGSDFAADTVWRYEVRGNAFEIVEKTPCTSGSQCSTNDNRFDGWVLWKSGGNPPTVGGHQWYFIFGDTVNATLDQELEAAVEQAIESIRVKGA